MSTTGGERPQAAERTRNGIGVNTVDLTSNAIPRRGSVWLASLDCSAFGNGLATLSVSPDAVDGVPTIYGERLIGGSLLLRSQQPFVGGASSFAWTLPIDPVLVGLEVHAQGLCWSVDSVSRPKLRKLRGGLSNALDMILGF